MARLPLVDPKTATGRAREIFDGPLKGKHFNIFRAMANAPAALDTYLGMAGALATSALSAAEREVVQLAVGQLNSCEYCVAAHTQLGKGAGLTEHQTVEARLGSMTDPRLHALAAFALAINEKRGHVTDDDIADFRSAGYGDAEIAETVAVVALAIYTNYFNHVAATAIDFPAPPMLPVTAGS